MAMLGIVDRVEGIKVGITLIGNTYADRLNVKDVLVEELEPVEISQTVKMALEEEIIEQIWQERGYYFDWFKELLTEHPYSEICMVGKY